MALIGEIFGSVPIVVGSEFSFCSVPPDGIITKERSMSQVVDSDLAGFVALARSGYHGEQPTQVEIDAEAMASAALQYCGEFDDATLRGLTRFIACCRVQPARAHMLLQGELDDVA